MIVTKKIAVIVVFPAGAETPLSDVAGSQAGEYLLAALGGRNDTEVAADIGSDPALDALLASFPAIGTCQLAAAAQARPRDRGLLIVDGRSWFSDGALDRLISDVRMATRNRRFTEAEGDAVAVGREARTLAVFVAPRQNSPAGVRWKAMHGAAGLDEFVRAPVFGEARPVVPDCIGNRPAAMLLASPAELSLLERHVLSERAAEVMKRGTRIRDPQAVYIRGELICGAHVTIEPNVIFEGRVVLGDKVTVGANSILRDCDIGGNTMINPFSLVEQSTIGSGSFVGPYGRVRPGSAIGDNVQIGNYVEIKNSRIGDGGRINHHSFIGDAVLESRVTIGAGTITCNHDGVGSQPTSIQHGAYVGSGCNLVAPVRIGEGAVIGAGSTITQDVPAGKLTLARQRQTTMESWRGFQTGKGGR